ncbi:MAG: quinoprotein dehydrogenase-associated putative ABC transporter substrate-binding protein [Betaproteobacteria bacterium]|nr:quinoprotein dehydrogenase-associated putative ABC transporter substrate-binding protein [Betaproteobacteria bacterium]
MSAPGEGHGRRAAPPSGRRLRWTAAIVGAWVSLWLYHADTYGRPPARDALVVCADPANLPFSDRDGDGFENRIAELLGHELGLPVRYRWGVTWRGSFLRALRKGDCDVIVGVPAGLEGVSVTRPLYTSSYVFVSDPVRRRPPTGFDDPGLRGLLVGVHAISAHGANTPVAYALASRGMSGNVVGFPMWGDGADTPGRIVSAVVSGRIDTAVVWGPIGGYYASLSPRHLDVTPVARDARNPAVPLTYTMSLGVREGDVALREALDAVLARKRAAIRSILAEFGVPLVDDTRTVAGTGPSDHTIN